MVILSSVIIVFVVVKDVLGAIIITDFPLVVKGCGTHRPLYCSSIPWYSCSSSTFCNSCTYCHNSPIVVAYVIAVIYVAIIVICVVICRSSCNNSCKCCNSRIRCYKSRCS